MKTLIKQIISNDITYAKFLNTLSLMEYVGARKIMKSQQYRYINKKILDHIAEETRHAQLLKSAAIKLEPDICKTYKPEALFCGEEAHDYFQAVDLAASCILKEHHPWHCYLYTTFLIEKRVLLFYDAFEKELKASGRHSVFRGILAEEKNHLEEVSRWLEAVPHSHKNILTLQTIEEEAFEIFLAEIERNLETQCSFAT